MADPDAVPGLIDIDALDDEDGGLDDRGVADLFPRPAGYVSRAERAAGEWRAQREANAVTEFDTAQVAASTLAKYETGWRDFGGYCTARGIEPLDATPDDVRAWILQLTADGLKVPTIEGRMAAIRWHFAQADLPSPTTTASVAGTLDAARRRIGEVRRRARPLSYDDLRRIVAGIPTILNEPADHPRVLRDRAMLTLGWSAALRVSEIVALDVDDITVHGDADHGQGGAIVHIGRSKTDQTGQAVDIGVPFSRHLNSCPVRATMALTRKLTATTDRDPLTGHRLPNQTNTGPLFRNINRGGRLGNRLTRQGADHIINHYIAAVVDDPTGYSTHSLRAGFITECSNHGIAEGLIRRVSRHTSSAGLNPYDRPQDLLTNGPLTNQDWY
ncbi:MAG: tyrosine-type recombinase/integrase [Actinomycetota bacterium]